MTFTDETHDPSRRSWIDSAQDEGTDFPIQNLPYGVFRRADDQPRIGVAIGDAVFDVCGAAEMGLLDDLGGALTAPALNELLALGDGAWRTTRHAIAALLDADTATVRDDAALRARLVLPQADLDMVVPTEIGDYTDFYCSIHHATNVGSMFRPDNPLMPNYKHLPVGYHGRASSIVASGAPVHRPMGQTIAADADAPTFGPCRLLDYEMEMGFFTGPATASGERIEMNRASRHIFGMCIVNDWSARDVQKWEYQPLGPFNAKNFLTSVGPWVVTLDALAPFRVAGPLRPADDPPVLDYLRPADDMGVQINVEVLISSEAMRAAGQVPVRVSVADFGDMYWTIAQMLVHHTSTGCNIRPGDLIASGTVSGPAEENRGCLLERTWRGQQPIELPDGTQRKFLQDGDEVVMRAWCEGGGATRIGFGECRGIVHPVTG
ncbi:MAG: fumarylacetoacetase [Planctomycetota bacterium]|jgi:fumarylacetoacetase